MFISSLYVMTCHAICVVAVVVVGIFECNHCSSIVSHTYAFDRIRICSSSRYTYVVTVSEHRGVDNALVYRDHVPYRGHISQLDSYSLLC